MPLISAKCPNCGGDIQLDDSHEFGFCLYCGAKVMFKDAVQKIKGNVTVEGIAGLEKLLENADTYFLKLGNAEEALKILTYVTEKYPESWEGWYKLGQIQLSLLQYEAANKDAKCNPEKFTEEENKAMERIIQNNLCFRHAFLNAVRVASKEKAAQIKQEIKKCLDPFMDFLNFEQEKLDKGLTYLKKVETMQQKITETVKQELTSQAEKKVKDHKKRVKCGRFLKILLALLDIVLFCHLWPLTSGLGEIVVEFVLASIAVLLIRSVFQDLSRVDKKNWTTSYYTYQEEKNEIQRRLAEATTDIPGKEIANTAANTAANLAANLLANPAENLADYYNACKKAGSDISDFYKAIGL